METNHISCALSGVSIHPKDKVVVLLLLNDNLITTPIFGEYDGAAWITNPEPLPLQIAEDVLGAMGGDYVFPEDGSLNLKLLSKLISKDDKHKNDNPVELSFIHRNIYDSFLSYSKQYVKSVYFEYPFSHHQQLEFNSTCVEFGIDQEATNHIFATIGETFELAFHLIHSACEHPSIEKSIARMVIDGTLSDDESMDLLEMYTNECIIPSKSQSVALRKFNAGFHFNSEHHYGYVNCVEKLFQWMHPVYQASMNDLENIHLLHFDKTINGGRVKGLLTLCKDDPACYEMFENIQAFKNGLESSKTVLRRSIHTKGIEAVQWGSIAIARGVLDLAHQRALDSVEWISACDGGRTINTSNMSQTELTNLLINHELDETWWS